MVTRRTVPRADSVRTCTTADVLCPHVPHRAADGVPAPAGRRAGRHSPPDSSVTPAALTRRVHAPARVGNVVSRTRLPGRRPVRARRHQVDLLVGCCLSAPGGRHGPPDTGRRSPTAARSAADASPDAGRHVDVSVRGRDRIGAMDAVLDLAVPWQRWMARRTEQRADRKRRGLPAVAQTRGRRLRPPGASRRVRSLRLLGRVPSGGPASALPGIAADGRPRIACRRGRGGPALRPGEART
jgi:hypothetical protein